MTPYQSIGQVIRAVTDRAASVGILPMPHEDDLDPWWRFFVSDDEATPRILARLPFAGRGNARSDGGDALAVGSGTLEATGADHSLIVFETRGAISRARIFSALAESQLTCTFFADYKPGRETALNLIELSDFVLPEDPRLAHFKAHISATTAVERMLSLGSYATPLAMNKAAPATSTDPQIMTAQSFPLPRPGILDVAPYVGGEARRRPASIAPSASPRTRARWGRVPRRWPPSPRGRRKCIAIPMAARPCCATGSATHYGLDPSRIVCGSGSDELIALLVRTYVGPGDEVLYSRHGFLMYPIAAKTAGASAVAAPERDLTTDVDAMLARVTDKTRIVFLANPNNPTGTYISADEVKRLHAGLPPTVLLAIDAAYAEFVTRNDYEPGIALVEKAQNVVMLRTFSKIYALGGLRLGWAYGSAPVVDALNRVRSPFNVNAAAQAAGVAALGDVAAVDRAREHNDIWLPWFTRELRALGLTVNPSVGNFVIVRFPDAPSRNADAASAHLQSRGILTRKMGGYGLPEWLRITIGTGEEMRVVLATIAEFLAGS